MGRQKPVEWLFLKSTGWWLRSPQKEACLSPFGVHIFISALNEADGRLIRCVENLGLVIVSCQRNGVAVESQGS